MLKITYLFFALIIGFGLNFMMITSLWAAPPVSAIQDSQSAIQPNEPDLITTPPVAGRQLQVSEVITYYVNTSSPALTPTGLLTWTNAFTNLQDALAVVTPNNEIWVAQGVYYPDANLANSFELTNGVAIYGGFGGMTETLRNQRDWTTNITVLSGDIDQNDTTTDDKIVTTTNHIMGDNSNHVVVLNDGYTATLDGFTITAGQAGSGDGGGGLFNNGGNLTLSNLIFIGNRAEELGGGMYSMGGNSSLNNVTFTRNRAVRGGGLANEQGGTVDISTGLFDRNIADLYGGAIYNPITEFGEGTGIILTGTITLTFVSLYDNRASGTTGPGESTGDGGGIFNEGGIINLVKSRLHSNTAKLSGGGLYSPFGATFMISQTSIYSNLARTRQGGGLYMRDDSTATIVNSTISGNRALGAEGLDDNQGVASGIYVANSNLRLIYSTVTNNQAVGEGGGIGFDEKDTIVITASIVAGNTSLSPTATAPNCYNYDMPMDTLSVDAYNIFDGTDGTDSNDACIAGITNISLMSHSLTITDVLEPLAANDVPTPTHALISGSVALDHIPFGISGCGTEINTDQRGRARPGIYRSDSCDIGAFEDSGIFDLSLVKMVTPNVVAPSGLATYTLVFTNKGTGKAADIVLSDTIPTSVTVQSIISSGVSITQTSGGPNYVWEVGDLERDESGIMTITVLVDTGLAGGFILTNTAAITSASDLMTENNIAPARLQISPVAPMLNAIANQTITETDTLTFTVTASDSNSDSLIYGLFNAPSGATINETRGVFIWSPSEAQGFGVYTFTLVVTDTSNLTDSQAVVITVTEVNVAPILAPIDNQTVIETVILTFTAIATDSDIPAQTLTYGLFNAPSGATINPNTGLFTWTPSVVQGPGVYTFTVVVSDTDNLTATEQVIITVMDRPDLSLGKMVTPTLVSVNELFTYTLSFSNTGPSTAQNILLTDTFPASLTIQSIISSGVEITQTSSGQTYSWQIGPLTSHDSGIITISVVLDDGLTGGLTLTNTAEITSLYDFTTANNRDTAILQIETVAPVLNPIEDQTITETIALTLTISASDNNNDSLTYGLGKAPAGTNIDARTGLFTWTPTEAQGPWVYTFTLLVTDTTNLTDSRSVTITVNELDTAPDLEQISDQTITETHRLTFTVSATDADLPASALTYGLGKAPDGASIDANTGLFTWTPSAAQGPAIYPLSVVVTDTSGLTDSQEMIITVTEPNVAPVLDPISDKTITETFTLTFTTSAMDSNGDSLIFGLMNEPTGASIGSLSGLFTWTPTVAQGSQTYTFTIVVSDTGSPILTASQAIVIRVIEPTFSVIVTPTMLTMSEPDQSAMFVVSLSDQPVSTMTLAVNSLSPNVCLVSPAWREIQATNWLQGVVFTVTAVDDDLVEDAQACLIETTLSTNDPAYAALDPEDVQVMVLDDDQLGVVIVETEGDTQVSEDGQTDQYQLTLRSQPTHTVVISFTGDDEVDIVDQTRANFALTFRPATWSQAQTVTVMAHDDGQVEGTHVGTITHQVTSQDPAYQDWPVDSVTIIINDNDSAIKRTYLPMILKPSSQLLTATSTSTPITPTATPSETPSPSPTPCPPTNLTITHVEVYEDNIIVVIHNNGPGPVKDAFWVEAYVNPDRSPTQPNEGWKSLSSDAGLVWGIRGDYLYIYPDESITLTVEHPTIWPAPTSAPLPLNIPEGAEIYAQVDSANVGVSTGGVEELDEMDNIFGPVYANPGPAPNSGFVRQSAVSLYGALPPRED